MKPTYTEDGYTLVAGYRIRLLDTKKGKRYQVDLGTRSGKHVRKSFKDKQKAEQFARDSRNEALNDGIAILNFTDRQKTDAQEALKILEKHSVTLRDAARYYDKHHSAVDSTNDIAPLVDLYWKDSSERVERGELRSRSYSEQVKWLTAFQEAYRGTAVDVLTAKDIDAFLDITANGATVRENMKRHISIFYNWCVKSERLDVNPVAKCRKIKKTHATPEIYTAAQTEKVMQAACKFAGREVERLIDGHWAKGNRNEIVCYLALGFLAGIRPNEIKRLRWEDIDLGLGEIHVNATASKTGRARIVHISPNLKKFLAQYGAKGGLVFPMSDSILKRWTAEVMESAGVRSIQDGARKTFCTMFLARTDSVDQTMLQMGHVDSSMIFTNYHGLASNRKAQAKIYWLIAPKENKVIDFPAVKTA